MKRHSIGFVLALGILLAGGLDRRGWAQGPTIDTGGPATPGTGASALPTPGSNDSTLPTLGAGGNSGLNLPGEGGPLAGRLGPTVSRAPASVAVPGGTFTPPVAAAATARLPQIPPTDLPNYGLLAGSPSDEDQGPSNGMTLDLAIERIVRVNLDLLSKAYELPQAEADILTASLRVNPVFYADAQLVPYGQYSRARPGGPLQYDVNISYPLDVSHKRQSRIEVARRAKRALEASMQDAVRLQIDNLYNVYVSMLAARETMRLAKLSVEGLRGIRGIIEQKVAGLALPRAELNRVDIQVSTAEIGLLDSEETFRRAKLQLVTLLNMMPSETEAMQVRGTIFDRVPEPPHGDALIQIAMQSRPDLIAFQYGISRAEADVRRARAERFADVYMLFQPYTFQNNTPYGLSSTSSWALGVTVPLPIYNRNQGNIRRAELNVDQTRIQMEALKKQVIQDVRTAELEYSMSKKYVQQIERDQLHDAEELVSAAFKLWDEGKEDPVYYLNARKEYNDVLRMYRDNLVRHRNAMLDLNTAVGRRILP
jgi:cobalt-zinc-cadmium efflux system outer membrane protein